MSITKLVARCVVLALVTLAIGTFMYQVVTRMLNTPSHLAVAGGVVLGILALSGLALGAWHVIFMLVDDALAIAEKVKKKPEIKSE